MGDVTLILRAVQQDERLLAEQLLPLVYDELRRLAASRMALEAAGQTLQATALVHEAWIRLVKDGDRTWENRTHFFRAAAQAMRRILVERARHKSRLKTGGSLERLDIHTLDLAAATPDDGVLLINESLEQLETQDPDSARLVVLKFFGGLTNREIAGLLNITERTVERQWAYARAKLYGMITEAERGPGRPN
jgi:RNA polymerase sigma factor (TIGR02999 family)